MARKFSWLAMPSLKTAWKVRGETEPPSHLVCTLSGRGGEVVFVLSAVLPKKGTESPARVVQPFVDGGAVDEELPLSALVSVLLVGVGDGVAEFVVFACDGEPCSQDATKKLTGSFDGVM